MSETKLIYQLIPKVMQEVGAIGKSGFNSFDKYNFRSIEDIYNALQPALSKNGIFIVPRVLDSKENTVQTKAGADQVRIKVKVEYQVCASDGSSIVSIFEGEGIDRSDKATNKAMQASFKFMCSQLFCLAFEGMDDSDKESPPFVNSNQNKITNEVPKKLPPQVVQTKVEVPAHGASATVNSPVEVVSPKPIVNHAIKEINKMWENYKLAFNFGAHKSGQTFYQLGKNDTEALVRGIKSFHLKRMETGQAMPTACEEFLILADQYLESLK